MSAHLTAQWRRGRLLAAVVVIALITALLNVSPAAAAPSDLVISEFLASNDTGLADEDADFSDWIEVHNTGTTTVNMAGLGLTDDAANPTKWLFPAVSIAPNGYLVVFASSKDRTNPAGELHTNFKLSAGGEYLGLYAADGTTLIHHYSPEYPAQSPDQSYGINSVGVPRYFFPPTPGTANGIGQAPLAAAATANVDRGFYSAPISVALSTTTPGAQIRYTTNGSAPTSNTGAVYSTPIPISTTTTLRAAVFASGFSPSRVSTFTYLYLNDVINQPATEPGFPNGASRDVGQGQFVPLDMAMDPAVVSAYQAEIVGSLEAIPTMSMTADVDDIFGAGGFYLGDDIEKVTSIEVLHAGTPADNEQIDVGVESHSHDRLKRSLRLNFRSEYGSRTWTTDLLQNAPLNGDSATDAHRTLILRAGNNRSWARTWNPDATTYTIDQLYRDTQIAMTGVGSHGTFVHLYLNGVYWGVYNLVERPDDEFQSEYFGGSDDDWFFTNHGGAGSADSTRWDYLTGALKNKDMSVPANYAEMQTYLDVERFADYVLLNFWLGTTDWPQNNWYVANRNASSPQGTTPAEFFAWDGEWSLDRKRNGETPGAWVHPDFLTDTGSTAPVAQLWHALLDSPDFRQLFEERVTQQTAPGAPLSDAAAIARFDALNDYVESAVVAESARWGDSLETLGSGGAIDYTVTRTRDIDWQREVDDITTLLTGNRQRLIDALKSAGLYTGPTFAITEVHYNPLPPTPAEIAAGLTHANRFEFVELQNISGGPLDVAGLTASGDISFTLASKVIPAGGVFVIAKTMAGFSARHGSTQAVAGTFAGQLADFGDRTIYSYPPGNVIIDVTIDDVAPWPTAPDGNGPSLEIGNPLDDPNNAASWHASAQNDGNPGVASMPPVIRPGGVGIIEGASGQQKVVNVPVTLSYPSTTPVTVAWETFPTGGGVGHATQGVDYVAASGTVTFAPGQTSRVVPITVLGDNIAEPPLLWGEWAFVRFSDPSANASLDLGFFGLGIAVIIDDD